MIKMNENVLYCQKCGSPNRTGAKFCKECGAGIASKNMNTDPSTVKYIKAKISADCVVEKPDVIGAIFGQTEVLLGEELDLSDLQKSGRIGRIEVNVNSKKGKSEGEIVIPSYLDQMETATLVAALETIDRVGSYKARVEVKNTSVDIPKNIWEAARKEIAQRKSAQSIDEVTTYGPERCPAGPKIDSSKAIIVVESRAEVIKLFECGIKNVIAVESNNVPKTIQDLSKEKVVTAFVDSDRDVELVLRELLQAAEIDFVALAPKGVEIKGMTCEQIIKALNNKIPIAQYVEMECIKTEYKYS